MGPHSDKAGSGIKFCCVAKSAAYNRGCLKVLPNDDELLAGEDRPAETATRSLFVSK